MNDTIFILHDAYNVGKKLRINANHIVGYQEKNGFVEIFLVNNTCLVRHSVEQIDQLFIECFFMIKQIEYQDAPQNLVE